MSYSTLTCIVNTPSSWEDSFFIWSARTCASSRMENSLSAPQYPQERAEHSRTKLQEKANKPRWNRVSLTRKAARLLGVKSRGFSPVRLAMMAVRLQAGETRSLNWRRKEKLQGELLLQLRSVKYASPFSPAQVSTISSSKKQCNSLKSLSREENRSMRQRRVVVCFFLLILKLSVFRLRSVAPTPGSLAKCVWAGDSPQWGWKWEAGKRNSPTGAWISGSMDQGFYDAFSYHWEKEHWQKRARARSEYGR